MQRWSALSSNGVSFSRNSKAVLTSSVKSCQSKVKPETAIWLPGPPLHPQPALSAHKDTLLGTVANKSAVPTAGLQRPNGNSMGHHCPAPWPWDSGPGHLGHPHLQSSLAAFSAWMHRSSGMAPPPARPLTRMHCCPARAM